MKNIVVGQDRVSFLVEGKQENDTQYDQAMVTANNDTEIIKAQTAIELDFTEIKAGDTVEVIFTGPVAESYPVQGMAYVVKILTLD